MINFFLRNQFLCMLSLSQLWATLAKEALDSGIILPVSTEMLKQNVIWWFSFLLDE